MTICVTVRGVGFDKVSHELFCFLTLILMLLHIKKSCFRARIPRNKCHGFRLKQIEMIIFKSFLITLMQALYFETAVEVSKFGLKLCLKPKPGITQNH